MTLKLKLFCHVFIINLIFSPLSVLAAQRGFDQWMEGEINEFSEFEDARDKEFTEFLEKEWREFQVFEGNVRDNTPKPQRFPVAKITPDTKSTRETPKDSVFLKNIALPKEEQYRKQNLSKNKGDQSDPKIKQLFFDFFGASIAVNVDKRIIGRLNHINKESISTYWKNLSAADYVELLDQLVEYKKEHNLGDWGFYLLLKEAGKAIFGDAVNEANLFIWFSLSKSGYDARIGYNKNSIHLLLPTKSPQYSKPYFKYGDKKYYVTQTGTGDKYPETISSYKGKYPGADKIIDLKISLSPSLKLKIKEVDLKFKYKGEPYKIAVKTNENMVAFYASFPQTSLKVYFKAPIASITRQTLLSSLEPVLQGKTEQEAVNLLLRFVQTAFNYKTDQEQFGKEKFMFPEEIFSSKFSDCEDRAFLFAYLVKNLIGLDVIGLDLPGHVATAVKFTKKILGASISHNNSTYYVCDPTYINAVAGMVMKKFKDIVPQIVNI